MTVGKNTVSGDKIRGYIERVEAIRAEKKDLGKQETAIWAEAKAEGFSPNIMKTIVKRRSMKPGDLEEAESMLDMYQHALGMLPEPPLFRAVEAMNVDTAARDSVLDALKQLVPSKGDLIVRIGDDPVRLFRNEDGEVVEDAWRESEPRTIHRDSPTGSRKPKAHNAPVETPEEAEAMGAKAYADNQPIIANPFPPGSEQRARFDLGYRKASGGDGMGDD